MTVQFWTLSTSIPRTRWTRAVEAEAAGWDGMCFSDSQCLHGDPYVAMTACAARTSRLGLSTGVTNPYTRIAAVTASAIAGVQEISGGRAQLGVGRGDSALAYVGRRPAPPGDLERYVATVTRYLSGDGIPLDELAGSAGSDNDARLPLGAAPGVSRLEWLRPSRVAVPVWVVASGPKVIRIAARHADQLTLAVGANPERVRWGVDLARSERQSIRVGAYVNVVVDDDVEQARRISSGLIATFARFSAMHGSTNGPVSSGEREVFEQIPRRYEMTRHGQAGRQTDAVTNEFASQFAILGPAAQCVERLLELHELGVDTFYVLGASVGVEPAVARRSDQLFETRVLPAVKQQASAR